MGGTSAGSDHVLGYFHVHPDPPGAKNALAAAIHFHRPVHAFSAASL